LNVVIHRFQSKNRIAGERHRFSMIGVLDGLLWEARRRERLS